MSSPQTWALHGGPVCDCRPDNWPQGLRKVHYRMSCVETRGCGFQLKQSVSCGVRYVACHVQMALLLSFLGPPWCQWCSDWCALGCSATVASGCVWLSDVFSLVEVFSVVTTWSVLLSVVLDRVILCGPLERWGAGRLLRRGIRLHAAAASCAHLLVIWEVWSQWHGCKCS